MNASSQIETNFIILSAIFNQNMFAMQKAIYDIFNEHNYIYRLVRFTKFFLF